MVRLQSIQSLQMYFIVFIMSVCITDTFAKLQIRYVHARIKAYDFKFTTIQSLRMQICQDVGVIL